MQRYQWKVLPQGMANSPTLCQHFVNQTVKPNHVRYPTAYIIHYMDNILLAHSDQQILYEAFADLRISLELYGLCLAPEKVQNIWDILVRDEQFTLKNCQSEQVLC